MPGRIDYGKATFKAVENPMTKRFVNEESNRTFFFLTQAKGSDLKHFCLKWPWVDWTTSRKSRLNGSTVFSTGSEPHLHNCGKWFRLDLVCRSFAHI